MKEEERTVLLGALLQGIDRYWSRQSVEQAKATEPHESTEADFVASWRTNLARCVDANLLATLVLRDQSGRHSIDASPEKHSVSHHHRALARLVSCASQLASSEDAATHTASLAPIFNRVELERASTSTPRHFRPRALTQIGVVRAGRSPDADEPPFFAVPGSEASSSELTLHLDEFELQWKRSCEHLDWENFECVYTHFLNLLQTYGWCLPAEGQPDPPDVSWYDQARVTSAIAACLYQFHAVRGTIKEEAVSAEGQSRCLLLTGDVSGIQEYIYGISTTGAGGVAKRLRARSFFVQLLSEAASQRVLREFELPLANLLMASGGNFYVLLPNLPDAAGRLMTLQRDFDEWLLRETHGALAINLAWTNDLPDTDFAAGKYSAVVSRLHARLRQRKAQRLARALQDEKTWRGIDVFAREPFKGDEQVCKACNRFPARKFSKPKTDRTPDTEADICDQCFDQQKLGRDLTKAQYVLFYDDDKGAAEGRISCLGFKVSVRPGWLPESARPAPFLVLRLNNPDLGNVTRLPAAVRYLANHVPSEDNGIPWTFEDIAAGRKLAEHENSSKLLGVLKADVDHLGLLFQEGLRRDAPGGWDSISRITSLSRQLDWFFSGWLEWLLTTSYQECYAVYSGGDDLLIVGPREKTLDLARTIHNDFARYTQNDGITISAGIAVVKPRLPLSHTVKQADGALKRAKEMGRNRLAMLGEVVRWKDLTTFDNILALLQRSNPPSAFLYQLLRFAGMWREFADLENRDTRGLRLIPMLAETLARNVDRRKQPELFDWGCGLLSVELGEGQVESDLNQLALTVDWAILNRREQ